MIISASYKTDIPAFYGEWFLNRLRAGRCVVLNPYNQRPREVSLRREDVEGFVFWTRNTERFGDALREVRARGFPFYVQFTLAGYPRTLEEGVLPAPRALRAMRSLAEEFGPRACIWRYDPILFTSLTPPEYHLAQFEQLAGQLRGATDEVVVSFAQFYAKTRRNLAAHPRQVHGFTWHDPADGAKRQLIAELAALARSHGMTLSICAQRHLLVAGAADARCIDPLRLSDLAGRRVTALSRPHRKTCGCHASCDIGHYNTCPQGCIYCYAVASRRSAMQNLRHHDPHADSLRPLAPNLPVAE